MRRTLLPAPGGYGVAAVIRFENLTKSFRIRGERKLVIDNLNLTLPRGNLWRCWGATGRASRPCCR